MSGLTVYVEAPTPVSVIVARVCICVLSGLVVCFGGVITLVWLGLDDAACELVDDCAPGFWPAGLPFAISVACALVAIGAAFVSRWAGLAWFAGLIALAVGTVCPVLVLGLL